MKLKALSATTLVALSNIGLIWSKVKAEQQDSDQMFEIWNQSNELNIS